MGQLSLFLPQNSEVGYPLSSSLFAFSFRGLRYLTQVSFKEISRLQSFLCYLHQTLLMQDWDLVASPLILLLKNLVVMIAPLNLLKVSLLVVMLLVVNQM